MLKTTEKITYSALGLSLLLLAINAFAGGYFGMTGAPAIPTEWLKGSPLLNYFIPGLMLFAGVGGSALFAARMIFRPHSMARTVAPSCGYDCSCLECGTDHYDRVRFVATTNQCSGGRINSFIIQDNSKI
ncbi:MAG TPA: hypothetical protein VFV68_08175 [Agriterribacter sp.]|nr:hypothetical protein [Agriterribacter sp.]